MHTVTLEDAKSNFELMAHRVLADAEPAIVNMPGGDGVVVLPLGDYESWQETAYLLKTPANAAHLRKSLAEASTGTVQPQSLVD